LIFINYKQKQLTGFSNQGKGGTTQRQGQKPLLSLKCPNWLLSPSLVFYERHMTMFLTGKATGATGYPLTSSNAFKAACLIKYTENSTFTIELF
jgi:hypothetical protein